LLVGFLGVVTMGAVLLAAEAVDVRRALDRRLSFGEWWGADASAAGRSAAAAAATSKPTEPEEEPPLVQRLYKPRRVSKKDEADFACMEVDCIRACVAKIACQTEHCTREKTKSCHKTCAKERCAARCKHEPKASYVERELRLETCVEACGDDDPRCKARCEDESRACKDRCKERAARFMCVRRLAAFDEPPEPADASPSAVDVADVGGASDEPL